MTTKHDFGGYATKNNLRCSDGRVIMRDAFKDCDGKRVPLVWNHMHNDPSNVLGHAQLENRADGVYAYCDLNDTDLGLTARSLVKNGDINSLSIYANHLTQSGSNVMHGDIKEVSLVLAGANPGAMIDNVTIEHSDGSLEESQEEAVLYCDCGIMNNDLEHSDNGHDDNTNHASTPNAEDISGESDNQGDIAMSDTNTKKTPAPASDASDGKTVGEVYDSMNDDQKAVCDYLVGVAVQQAQEGDNSDEDVQHSDMDEDNDMNNNLSHNVFDSNDADGGAILSHSDMDCLFADSMNDIPIFGSFKKSVIRHASTYGITNIDVLFPDAKSVTSSPQFVSRQMGWVTDVLGSTTHTPFANISSTIADITADDARAKGYIKGNQKIEEFFSVAKRKTTPTTVYKKQKLDRDDILDITDFDVVQFMQGEMRLMLNEELARAYMIGDGRSSASQDKINEGNIRPILNDDELYAIHVNLALADITLADGKTLDYAKVVKAISKKGYLYEGSGSPAFYTTKSTHTEMGWIEDNIGRRLYETDATLSSALGVDRLVDVPVMEGCTRSVTVGETTTVYNVIGIIVNLADYNVGTNKGGEINTFNDFDIDYNQSKYLMETRCSGALVKPHSALVIEYPKPATASRNAKSSKTAEPVEA